MCSEFLPAMREVVRSIKHSGTLPPQSNGKPHERMEFLESTIRKLESREGYIKMVRGGPEIHLSGGSSSRASTHSSTRCDRGCDVAN